MEKLYVLNYIESIESIARPLACSNSVDKLRQIVPCNRWQVGNDPNDSNVRRKSLDTDYPYYEVREMPYVC